MYQERSYAQSALQKAPEQKQATSSIICVTATAVCKGLVGQFATCSKAWSDELDAADLGT
jgi:hypothetical protein